MQSTHAASDQSQTSQRRIVALAEGSFSLNGAKTAIGVIRYSRDRVVAILDSTKAGGRASDVIAIGHDIPIVATLADAMPLEPDTLLIGISPRGGSLPAAWRATILEAIQNGLDVVNGLHFMFADDPEFAAAAAASGVRIWDLRRPPEQLDVAHATPHRPGSYTVLTVGTDCNVGKMTVSLEIDRLARQRGLDAAFVATGQTGIMIAGNGIAIDRVIGDFMAGAIEELVVAACESHEWVFVEGQGSLFHPAYSGVTLALMHGTAPDAMILCHQADRTHIRGYEIPIPPLEEAVRAYELAAGWLKPARVVGIAINTFGLDEPIAHAAIADASRQTGLPAADCIRFGAEPLLDALEAARPAIITS